MEGSEVVLDRRKFLKRVGLSSLAVASVGPLLALPAQASNGGALNFRWMSVSENAAGSERVVMNGDGFVNNGTVTAAGSWNHNTFGGPPPAPLLGFGTWKATRLVSLDIIGTYGAFAAGTIVMEVNLIPDGGGRIPAEVTMNCNLPPGGLFTGLPEGFFLTVDGSTFSPALLPVAGGGPPPMVALGATVFTLGVEQRN